MTPDLLRDNCNAAIMSMPRHRASHLDCRCFPILIVALQTYYPDRPERTIRHQL